MNKLKKRFTLHKKILTTKSGLYIICLEDFTYVGESRTAIIFVDAHNTKFFKRENCEFKKN